MTLPALASQYLIPLRRPKNIPGLHGGCRGQPRLVLRLTAPLQHCTMNPLAPIALTYTAVQA
jgi:hypothetical protein